MTAKNLFLYAAFYVNTHIHIRMTFDRYYIVWFFSVHAETV